jgi:aldose 1-epimerase
MTELIPLRAGALTAALCPAAGGSVAGFRADWEGGVELFRPADPQALAAADPRGLSGYPMIPFCNRIRDGRFTFEGQDYQLARNFNSPHTIHGNAWQRPWRVEGATASAATLVFEHDPARDGADAWPFAYEARLDARLSPEVLEVTISVANRDKRAMPVGFGLHPYMPRTADMEIWAQTREVWREDAELLPTERVPTPPEWDFARPRALGPLSGGIVLDNCFGGWNGAATLAWPSLGAALDISADPVYGHLVIYAPEGRPFVAVEPQTQCNDALNQITKGVAGTGLHTLKTGERIAGTMRFRPRRLTR